MKKIFLIPVLTLFAAIAFVLGVFGITFKPVSADGSTAEFACAVSASSPDNIAIMYGATSVTKLTENQATEARIPAGYTGSVYVVEKEDFTSGKGATLDFTQSNVPVAYLKSLTFRVYVGDDGVSDEYPELRIHRIDGGNDWAVRYDFRSLTNGWREVTLYADGTNFSGGHNFTHIATDGKLGRFELGVRCSKDVPFYIDAVSYEFADCVCTVSATTVDGVAVIYGSDAVVKYTATEAQTAGVPAGYEGEVYKVETNNGYQYGKGAALDFTALSLAPAEVRSLTFRIYVGDDGVSDAYPELRIHRIDGMNDWAVRYVMNDYTGTWHEVTLYADGTNFSGGHNFTHLSSNGTLGLIELAVRCDANVDFYIDSVSFEKDADDIPPVINYDGETTVYIEENAFLNLGITATDNEDGALEPEYIWPAGALNNDGSVKKGTHTLTVKATDNAGNVSTLVITVIAGEPDTTAPVITVAANELRVVAGTKPYLKPTATDESAVTLSGVWSSGALDGRGKLVVGTHTYTITATDAFGNSSQKTVTVYVTAEEYTEAEIIDESLYESFVQYSFYPADGTGDWFCDYIVAGSEITLPTCTFIPPQGCVFLAWAIGSVGGATKSAGETVVVNADTDFYAVYTPIAEAGFDDIIPTAGADIKVGEDLSGSGIRFEAVISGEDYAGFAQYITGIGMVIMPTDLIGEEEFTFENYSETATRKVFDTDGGATVDRDGNIRFKVSVTGLYAGNYNRAFSARAFVILSYDGITRVCYASYIEEDNSRTPYAAAKASIGKYAEDTDGYAVCRTIIDNVIDVSYDGATLSVDNAYIIAGDSSAALSKGKVTLNLKLTEERTFACLTYNGYRIKSSAIQKSYDAGTGILTYIFDNPEHIVVVKKLQTFDWDQPFDVSLYTAFDTEVPADYPGNTTEHRTEGDACMKMKSIANWQMILINLKVDGTVLTLEELDEIDYISIDIFVELPDGMAGTDFYFYNQIMGWLTAGAHTLTITGAQFKAQMESAATAELPAYNSETGWGFFQIQSAGVWLYFDNCFAVYK